MFARDGEPSPDVLRVSAAADVELPLCCFAGGASQGAFVEQRVGVEVFTDGDCDPFHAGFDFNKKQIIKKDPLENPLSHMENRWQCFVEETIVSILYSFFSLFFWFLSQRLKICRSVTSKLGSTIHFS